MFYPNKSSTNSASYLLFKENNTDIRFTSQSTFRKLLDNARDKENLNDRFIICTIECGGCNKIVCKTDEFAVQHPSYVLYFKICQNLSIA